MRKVLAAIALACLPLAAVGLSACTTQVEQLAPKSPRNALAEAEIAFAGVANIAARLYGMGAIDTPTIGRIISEMQDLSAKLDQAHVLLKAGETLVAVNTIEDLSAALSALSLELSIAAERRVEVEATPAPVIVPAPPGAI